MKGGSPGLVVVGGDACFEGFGFVTHHWMYIFSHSSVVKNVMLV